MTKTNVEGTFTKVSDTLIEDEKYKDLSGLSILLYSLYARRLTCSINSAKNGNKDFVDEKVIHTLSSLMKKQLKKYVQLAELYLSYVKS